MSLLLSFLLVLSACSNDATVVDACVEDTGLCAPCDADDDCAFLGNPCLGKTYCAEKDAVIETPDVGCFDDVPDWPDPETCACHTGVCRYVEP